MDRWKSRGGKTQRGEKQEDAGALKGRKVAKHCVFPMICGSRGSKSNLAKAAGCGAIWPDEKWKVARRCSAKHISKSKCAKHLSFGAVLEVAMSKKCTPLWREAHFQVKKDIRHHVRTTFGSWDGATKHISKSCTKHTNVGALLELEMSKSARRCGAKHISKSKVSKTDGPRPLLKVEMSKNCTLLWLSKSKC